MYVKYQPQGLTIIGVPCNQFAFQEPGSNADVKKYALSKNATFPFLSKSTVNDPMCDPSTTDGCTLQASDCCPVNNQLYTYLRSVLPGELDWNYCKFLVDKKGVPIKRWPAATVPYSIEPDIEAALAA